jgi:hypothetical protein
MPSFGRIQSKDDEMHRLGFLIVTNYICHYRYLLPTYESDPLLTAIDDGEDNDDTDINLPDAEANQKYLQQAAAHAQQEK